MAFQGYPQIPGPRQGSRRFGERGQQDFLHAGAQALRRCAQQAVRYGGIELCFDRPRIALGSGALPGGWQIEGRPGRFLQPESGLPRDPGGRHGGLKPTRPAAESGFRDQEQ